MCVCVCMCVCIPILVTTQWYGTIAAHTRRRASVLVVVFCMHMHSFAGLIRRTPRRRSVTLQSPTATLIPLFSSSELTGCGYPGLLDRKNRSDMCPPPPPLWESNPRLPACKASTLPTRPGSLLPRTRGVIVVVGLSVAYYASRKMTLFLILLRIL